MVDNYLLEIEGHVINYNKVKDVVLSRLRLDEIITEKQLEEYLDNWQVIIVRKTWFKKWAEKFVNGKGDYIIKYVKFED